MVQNDYSYFQTIWKISAKSIRNLESLKDKLILYLAMCEYLDIEDMPRRKFFARDCGLDPTKLLDYSTSKISQLATFEKPIYVGGQLQMYCTGIYKNLPLEIMVGNFLNGINCQFESGDDFSGINDKN